MKSHPTYELLEEIGKGDSAMVYRARDLELKRNVAIKELHDKFRSDPRRMEQFWEGARFLANLQHDSIVQVYGLDKERGWVVMELMQGSLADKLAHGALPAEQVRGILRQGLEGLQYLHTQGYLHGDVKPANLLINSQGRVKLSDSAGGVVGGEFRKPTGRGKYLAPELLNPAFGPVGPGVDLYCLGFTALELLKGRSFNALFKGAGTEAIDPEMGWLRWHSSEEETLPPVGDLVPGLPADLARVLDRLLAKPVAERYASAALALKELENRPVPRVEPAAEVHKAALPRPVAGPAVVPIAGGPPRAEPPRPPRPPAPAKADRSQPAPRPFSKEWLNKKLSQPLVLYPLLGAILLAVAAFFLWPESEESQKVHIASDPEGATVLIDGQKRKIPTNGSYGVDAGEHTVRLELEGYKPEERKFKVPAEGKPEDLKLAFSTRLVRVNSDPPGASVKIDGQLQDKKAGEVFELAVGKKHTVEAEADGRTGSQEVEVKAGDKQDTIQVALQAAPAQKKTLLRIDAQPAGATVRIDQAPQPKKPGGEYEVAPGKHVVKVELAGYDAQEKNVEAKAETTVPVQFILKKTPPATMVVHVHSTPAGADVLVDGKAVDKRTDCDLDLPPGRHTVKLSLSGYDAQEKSLEVLPGVRPDALAFDLTKTPPSKVLVRIQSVPSGAAVSIDGKKQPKKTDCDLELPPGTYAVRIELEGYKAETSQLTLREGQRADPLQFRLTALPILVRIVSEPPDATVKIDGKKQDKKTNCEIELVPGRYKVAVELPGYQPQETELNVRIGEAAGPVRFTLKNQAVLKFEEGKEALAAGEWDRAIGCFDEAVKLDARFVDALDLRGTAYYAKHDVDRAIADFTQCVRLDGKYARAYNQRGLCYLDKHEYNLAINDFDEAIKINARYASAYNNRGILFRARKDYERAVADFSEALKIDGSYTLAYANRGLAYLEKKDFDRAIADYTEALKLDPKVATDYHDRGLCYIEKKDWERAIRDYDEALKLEPKYASAFHHRGLCRAEKQDHEGAIADYSEAIKLDSKYADPYYYRSLEYDQKGDTEGAKADREKAAILDFGFRLHIKKTATLVAGLEITGVAFSPDGLTLASGSVDTNIRLWETATGRNLVTFRGHTTPVHGLAFSPDGKVLASASDEGIKLWDAVTGKNTNTLTGHTGTVWSVQYSPNGKVLASAGQDKTIHLWNAETGKEILVLKGHTDVVEAIGFSPDGKVLASASHDKTLKLWEVSTGKEKATLKGHTGEVHDLTYSPDGKLLASAAGDRSIKLWDTSTGKEKATFRGHAGEVRDLDFSPDGKVLASASEDRTIKLWDVATGQNTATLSGHSKTVTAVAFSPDGKTLVSGSADKTVRLWVVEGEKK